MVYSHPAFAVQLSFGQLECSVAVRTVHRRNNSWPSSLAVDSVLKFTAF
eukprot:COSAG02_NODE_23778_length_708_cov_1.354680_2_plen_48_part_01